MNLRWLVLGAVLVLVLPGCDPNGDFVFGTFDANGHEAVLDAWSGPSGESPMGTAKIQGTVIGYVGCLEVTGNQAIVGLDMSPSIGLTALARITDNGGSTPDTFTLSPSGIPASQVCGADLEPGPPLPANLVVRDAPVP